MPHVLQESEPRRARPLRHGWLSVFQTKPPLLSRGQSFPVREQSRSWTEPQTSRRMQELRPQPEKECLRCHSANRLPQTGSRPVLRQERHGMQKSLRYLSPELHSAGQQPLLLLLQQRTRCRFSSPPLPSAFHPAYAHAYPWPPEHRVFCGSLCVPLR